MRRLTLAMTLAFSLWTTTALAGVPAGLSPEIVGEIDAAAARILEETGVPSASVAVVRDGSIALTKAYGQGRLGPPTPASPSMRYAIGSISKQFTATALVMLPSEGKLGLDDPLAKYFPDLTRAADITLRQLLSHTSGVRDFWPQDYLRPAMLEPITTAKL